MEPVTTTEAAAATTTRELQLELQIWAEHKATLQAKGEGLKAQAALLQIEAERTEQNIARLQTLLTPKEAPAAEVVPEADKAA